MTSLNKFLNRSDYLVTSLSPRSHVHMCAPQTNWLKNHPEIFILGLTLLTTAKFGDMGEKHSGFLPHHFDLHLMADLLQCRKTSLLGMLLDGVCVCGCVYFTPPPFSAGHSSSQETNTQYAFLFVLVFSCTCLNTIFYHTSSFLVLNDVNTLKSHTHNNNKQCFDLPLS